MASRYYDPSRGRAEPPAVIAARKRWLADEAEIERLRAANEAEIERLRAEAGWPPAAAQDGAT